MAAPGRQRRQARWAGTLGLVVGLGLAIAQPPALQRLMQSAFDQYQRWQPRQRVQQTVRVLEIDDAALAKFGQWPWPRDRLAQLTQRLEQAGAAAVVYDIIFAEADRSSPLRMLQTWTGATDLQGPLQILEGVLGELWDYDQQFAQALSQAPSVLHLTAQAGDQAGPCPPPLAAAAVKGLTPAQLSTVATSYKQLVPALPLLREASHGEGFAKAGLGSDAVIRSVPLVALACYGQSIYPHLAVEALRVGAARLDPASRPPGMQQAVQRERCSTHVNGVANQLVSNVRICGISVPTTPEGGLWVHYSPATSTPQRGLSLAQVWDWPAQQWTQTLAGKIVFIGATAEGLRDFVVTPLGDERPGVHAHAEVVEQILAGQTIYRAWDLFRPVEMVVGVLLAMALVVVLPQVPATVGFVVWLTGLALSGGLGFLAFAQWRWLLDPVTPMIIVTSSFLPLFVVMFQQEQNARRFIRGAFGKFLSPLLLERLEDDPGLLKLEGESREITAFFSDIRSFTTLSENLSPQQVTTFLNQYFTVMTRLVVDNRGLVDKYMGDGLAAMWNAPVDVDDHSRLACEAAMAMQQALGPLNERWQADPELPLPIVRIGIGLHLGPCRVGNFGSEDHLEYSMLGDNVNLTSRLESLTKDYGVGIIGSAELRAAVPDLAWVALGAFTVKGRSVPTQIYALLGDAQLALDAEFQAVREGMAALSAILLGPDAPQTIPECPPELARWGLELAGQRLTRQIVDRMKANVGA